MSNWLTLTVGDQLVTQEGMGLVVGMCLGLFYVDDSVVGLRDPKWIQGELHVLIGLFHWYGLVENVAKYKAMKRQPGTLRSGISEEEAVGRQCMGRWLCTASF